VKILYWDRDGWVIWYKRLRRARFVPFAETGRKEIAAWELGVLLEGIDLSKGQEAQTLQPAGGAGAWGERRGSRIGSGGERKQDNILNFLHIFVDGHR